MAEGNLGREVAFFSPSCFWRAVFLHFYSQCIPTLRHFFPLFTKPGNSLLSAFPDSHTRLSGFFDLILPRLRRSPGIGNKLLEIAQPGLFAIAKKFFESLSYGLLFLLKPRQQAHNFLLSRFAHFNHLSDKLLKICLPQRFSPGQILL